MSQQDVWAGRYKVEDILEVHCPKCGRRPHEFCNRDGEKLSKRGRELRSRGCPPSHQERMWLRQGHDESEFDRLRGKGKPFTEAGQGKPNPSPKGDRISDRTPIAPAISELISTPFVLERTCPRCPRLQQVVATPVTVAHINYECMNCGHVWRSAGSKQVAKQTVSK